MFIDLLIFQNYIQIIFITVYFQDDLTHSNLIKLDYFQPHGVLFD